MPLRWSAPSWCCPGRRWDAASIAELIETEGVTVAAGVADAVLNNLLQHLEDAGRRAPGTLKADRRRWLGPGADA